MPIAATLMMMTMVMGDVAGSGRADVPVRVDSGAKYKHRTLEIQDLNDRNMNARLCAFIVYMFAVNIRMASCKVGSLVRTEKKGPSPHRSTIS